MNAWVSVRVSVWVCECVREWVRECVREWVRACVISAFMFNYSRRSRRRRQTGARVQPQPQPERSSCRCRRCWCCPRHICSACYVQHALHHNQATSIYVYPHLFAFDVPKLHLHASYLRQFHVMKFSLYFAHLRIAFPWLQLGKTS